MSRRSDGSSSASSSAKSRSREALVGAGRRDRHVALAGRRVGAVAQRRPAAARRRSRGPPSGAASGVARRSRPRARSGGASGRRGGAGRVGRCRRRRRRRRASKPATWSRCGDERGARRPVERGRGRPAGAQRDRAGEAGASGPASTGSAGGVQRARRARRASGGAASSARVSSSRAHPRALEAARARTASWSSRYLSTAPSVRSAAVRVEPLGAEQLAAPRPSRSPPRCPAASAGPAARSRRDAPRDVDGERRRRPGTRRRTISTSRSASRVVDPVVEAAALERVVQIARAVGGEDDDRRDAPRGSCRARDRHRRLGEQLEQERLEVVVGAVELVDEQHRRAAGPGARSPAAAGGGAGTRGRTGRPRRARSPRGLREPDPQQLPRVVPLVEGLGRVDALVALQADQRRVERARRAPWRPRSCRPRPRPPAAAAGGSRSARNSAVASALVGEVVDAVEPARQRLDVRRPRASAGRGRSRERPARAPPRSRPRCRRRAGPRPATAPRRRRRRRSRSLQTRLVAVQRGEVAEHAARERERMAAAVS